MNGLKGIHHVTAITSSAEKNYQFFTYILGMRLIKKTVNQDEIQTYHLFFADDIILFAKASAAAGERILEILKERNIQATFFVVGENVEKYPDIIKRMVEEGHSIGIHCYSHSYDDIYQSVEGFVTDFEKAKEAVQNIVDVEVWCYRFPGGSINSHNKYIYEDIIAEMSEMGYLYYDWNASMEDASKNVTKEQIIQSAVESTLGRKKVVMLGHDIVCNTSVCIEELIDSFPEYKFLPLTKEVTPIIFKP